jgi:hypothetical protein
MHHPAVVPKLNGNSKKRPHHPTSLVKPRYERALGPQATVGPPCHAYREEVCTPLPSAESLPLVLMPALHVQPREQRPQRMQGKMPIVPSGLLSWAYDQLLAFGTWCSSRSLLRSLPLAVPQSEGGVDWLALRLEMAHKRLQKTQMYTTGATARSRGDSKKCRPLDISQMEGAYSGHVLTLLACCPHETARAEATAAPAH